MGKSRHCTNRVIGNLPVVVVVACIAAGGHATSASTASLASAKAVAVAGTTQQTRASDFGGKRVITFDAFGARSVHAADLDRDGDADVLSASQTDNKIAWYENIGDGDFSEQRVITTEADGAVSVYAADLDGDGDADVLSASANDDMIAWHENLGDGAFSAQRVLTTDADGASSVHAADLDGDGDTDVLSASANDDKIAWHENLGDGAFSAQRVLTTEAGGASSVHAADLDGDGDVDVLSASANDDKVAWYENRGRGVFSEQQVINTHADGARSVHAADLDGDGDADMLFASANDDEIAWHENLGGGVFSTQRVITTNADGAYSVHVADIDADGDVDVVSASIYDHKIAWHENLGYDQVSGHARFSEQRVITADALGAAAVHAADLDGDGDGDVLSASMWDRKIAWHERVVGSGRFSAHRVIGTEVLNHSVHAVDLVGDGDADVLFASTSGVIAWFENRGYDERRGHNDGLSSQRIITREANGARSVRAADLDGDGDADVVSATAGGADSDGDDERENGRIAWHENLGYDEDRGYVAFSRPRVIATRQTDNQADGAWGVHTADLDGDGDLDLIGAWNQDPNIIWHENLGGGTFSEQRVISNEARQARSVFAVDLDGDGDADVLSASAWDVKVAWYENLGDGAFSGQRVITHNAHGANSVYATDLDGDGDADVLSSSAWDDKVAWYENLGGGAFSEQRVITADADDAWSVHAADVDLDGDADVLSASAGDDKIAWYENQGIDEDMGHVRFSEQRTITYEARGALSVHAADLDGDDDLDVLSASVWGGVAWYENRTVQGHQSAPAAAPAGVRVVAGVRRLTVTWTRFRDPADGGPPVTRYVAVATPRDGGPARRCRALPSREACVIEGLAPDVFVYDVKVHAENDFGVGPASAPVAATPTGSRRFVGEDGGDGAGWSVATGAGDAGTVTIIGAPLHSPAGRNSAGAVYLVAAADFAAADAADARNDGMAALGNAADGPGSWKLEGESGGDTAGWSVASVDGHDDGTKSRTYAVMGSPRSGSGAGAVHLVANADLSAADAADGRSDGVVDLGNVAAQAGSWKIVGGPGDRLGASVASAGDVDGDGHAELLVHGGASRRGAGFGAAFVLSLDDADLAAADRADGAADGVIESRRMAARRNFWEFYGENLGDRSGAALATVGDADGDGRADLLFGAPRQPPGGAAFLAAGGDFPGGLNGAVDAADLAERPASWRFVGERWLDHAGAAVAGAGDVTGDGLADMIVGAPGHSGGSGFAGGAAYLIASSNLAAMDRADADTDGTIDLVNVAAQSGSWKFVGGRPFEGVGAALSSAGDLDGDGTADLLVGTDAGGAYLVAVADLPNMDAADGSEDGVVDLRNAAAQANSWRIRWPGRMVGRSLNLTAAGDTDGDGSPDLLLAVAGTVWLLAAADLPVVLANIDAADGLADGSVGFDVLAARLAAPRDGNVALRSLDLYQGPLARTWDWVTDEETTHVPQVAGRRAALVVRTAHETQAAPELAVRILDPGGATLAARLQALLDPETTRPTDPDVAGWETAYTLDLPGDLHRAGNRALFQVDPRDLLDEVDERDNERTVSFDGLAVPRFDITFVPIRFDGLGPSRIDVDAYMEHVLDLLPVGDHRARTRTSLDFEGDEWSAREAARQILHRWNTDADGGELYHGVFAHPGDGSPCGFGYHAGSVAVSAAPDDFCRAESAAHEIGHNLSLRHAPGCGAGYPDLDYPYPLGGIGPTRGWLFSAGRFVAPDDGFHDLMSHCTPVFVSDYHYRKAAYHRSRQLVGASAVAAAAVALTSGDRAGATPARSLALTGSVDAFGNWSLDRVSASHRAPRLPRTGGTHTGRTTAVALLDASGHELHSEPLTMYPASHGQGGAWAARVPLLDESVRYVVIRTADGHVLFEEHLGTTYRIHAAEPAPQE